MLDRDAGHLRRGMHARIGASGGVQRIVGADDRVDLLFEDLLDAKSVCLPLPPGVVAAVVGDRQLERARHLKPLSP